MIKLFLLIVSLLSFFVHADNEQRKSSTSSASYGVSNIIPEWTPDLRDEEIKLKAQKGDFIAVPIPVVDPTIGTGLVVAGAYYHSQSAGERASQPASATQVVAAYTNNDSYAYGLIQKNYWQQDTWRFVSTAAYVALKLTLIDSQYSEDGSQLDWNIEGTLIKSELLRRFDENWYLGGQIRLINNKQTFSGKVEGEAFDQANDPDTKEDSDIAKANGLGLLVQYDSRDSQTNPYKGQRFEFDALLNSTSIGSTKTYQSFNLRYRYYHQLANPLVLSLETKGCAKSGHAPLWDYCTIGLRGFSATSYLDKTSFSAQSELRWRAWHDLGLVAFAGIGYNARSIAQLGDNNSVNSYGLGLRYMLLESQRINFRVDYARSGDDNALYVSVAEAF
ncbi:BamA/TamA family outer membrane protein [Colwellia sp. 12G3]|uniref:BamA/TamA family outer membrane protein n=1 Tax=Colwellia sp. 12G3 TaxID=2058299 RepID=UPI0012FF27CB|nr:BamA/TamA family outer membrane protein [Colwellia sp. 12G3]